MSELKVYHCNEWHNEYTEFYIKFEADKVIAELEESHKTEVKELLCLIRDKENNFNRAFDSEEKEIRHSKYKRCLAMARWCEEAYNRECGLNPEEMTNKEFYKQQTEFWNRWNSKWLKIAKKFKEVNK